MSYINKIKKFNISLQKQINRVNDDEDPKVQDEKEEWIEDLDKKIKEMEENDEKISIDYKDYKFDRDLLQEKQTKKIKSLKSDIKNKQFVNLPIVVSPKMTTELNDSFEDVLVVLHGKVSQFFPYHKVFTVKQYNNDQYLLTRNGQELGWFTHKKMINFFQSRKGCYTNRVPLDIVAKCDTIDVQFTQNYMYPTLVSPNGVNVQQFVRSVASNGFAFTFINYCIQAIHYGMFLLKPYLFPSEDEAEAMLLQKIYDFSTQLYNKQDYLPRIVALSVFLYSQDVVYV
jgi:vacuolar-type H+-ATPase subunit H